jgi:hypothetical protein
MINSRHLWIFSSSDDQQTRIILRTFPTEFSSANRSSFRYMLDTGCNRLFALPLLLLAHLLHDFLFQWRIPYSRTSSAIEQRLSCSFSIFTRSLVPYHRSHPKALIQLGMFVRTYPRVNEDDHRSNILWYSYPKTSVQLFIVVGKVPRVNEVDNRSIEYPCTAKRLFCASISNNGVMTTVVDLEQRVWNVWVDDVLFELAGKPK